MDRNSSQQERNARTQPRSRTPAVRRSRSRERRSRRSKRASKRSCEQRQLRSPSVHEVGENSRTTHKGLSKRRRVQSQSSLSSSEERSPRRKRSANLSNLDIVEKLLNVIASKNTTDVDKFPVLNVVPDFDPMCREQTVETWIHKVEECAQIYGWSDKQIVHYAMPKLCGVAKTWYQGLPSLLHSWSEWKLRLTESFPSQTNYAETLTQMLNKRAKFGESLEEYFYTKINLLNRCKIYGKDAVDCIIYGIDDRGVRLGAQGAQFSEPEQLLKFFKSVKINQPIGNDPKNKNTDRQEKKPAQKSDNDKRPKPQSLKCYNCNETGHPFFRCSKPTIRCNNCNLRGHLADNCPNKTNQAHKANVESQSVMEVHSTDNINAKYKIPIRINGKTLLSHIDLGSECTLIRLTDAISLGIQWKTESLPILRGLGNIPYRPVGRAFVDIDVQDIIEENVEILIVTDDMINDPVLLGHTYTERPQIQITKTNTDIIVKRCQVHDDSKLILLTFQSNNLKPHTTNAIKVKSDTIFCGRIYVHGTIRGRPGYEYFLLPGEYDLSLGLGTLIIQNICDKDINMPIDTLVTRARVASTLDVPNTYNILDIQLTDEALKCGNITQQQKFELVKLLEKYRKCFSSNLHELGYTTSVEMEIKLKDSEPVVYRPYRLSYSDRQLVQSMIQEMLESGIIRESSSPYASPIVLVQKKSGEKRLCVDYRALNRKTVKEHFPLPRIEDQLDLLAGNTMFITLDLASGYYQIPIAEESRERTAFITPDGQYEYNRMPFGLVNAPSVFQRAINKVLAKVRNKHVLIYMDDVLIPGRSFEDCLKLLEEVLLLLKSSGLTLKLEKCKFCFDKIEYLGFEVSADGIRPGSLKTDAVSKFSVPQNQHDVRRFIGLASFFRRFVKGFATIARPLTELLKKDAKWRWTEVEQNSFETLKQNLVQRPILALYDPRAETQLHTDASKIGIAGILMQKGETGVFHPVAYYSRQTTTDEQKLHSYELETLAVIASLNKFRVYLLGIKFTILTDCNSLRTTLTKRDLIPRIARWWIQFQEYDCSIEYRPGERMAHADALSRCPIPDNDCETRVLDVLNVGSQDWIATVQDNDDETKRIKNVLTDPQSQNAADIIKNYKIKNDKLYRIIEPGVLRWVVPKGVRWQILRANHDEVGHFGFEKTLERIKATFWFPKIRKFTKKYVNACLECAHHKVPSGSKAGFLHPIPKTEIPFHTIHADHLGPFNRSKRGNCYILVIIDSFTKYINITPVRNTKSTTSIRVLKEHISYFGTPTRLITDQGTSFTGKKFQDFVKSLGIKHIFNAVATPRANGQVERYNRTILAALGSMSHEKPKGNWDEYLPETFN